MRAWQLQLDSQRASSKAHLRLFGLVLISITIHSALLLSSPMRWEQSGEGAPALQIRMRSIEEGFPPLLQSAPQTAPDSKKIEPKTQKASTPTPIEKIVSQPAATRMQVKRQTHRPTPKKFFTEKRPLITEGEQRPPTRQVTTTPAPPPVSTAAQETTPFNDPQVSMAGDNHNSLKRDELTRQLKQELTRHFHYPPLAHRRGWQGVVTLAFTLETNGEVINIRIANSSGYGMLDRAALASLNKVGRIENAPLLPLSFELPVIYRLQSS